MNIRNVLKTYANLRQLTDDETALLNTLRQLNDTERELLVASLQPEKVIKRASKKPSKSKRASGIESAISRSNATQTRLRRPCTYQVDDNGGLVDCGEMQSNPIHDATFAYVGYHEFVPASTEQSKSVSGD